MDQFKMQELLNEVLNLEYINEVFIAVGALLVLVGLLKIVRNGLRILLWVLLTFLGAYGVAYGLDHSSNSITANLHSDLGAIVGPGKEFITEKLQNVCQSLNFSDTPLIEKELPSD